MQFAAQCVDPSPSAPLRVRMTAHIYVANLFPRSPQLAASLPHSDILNFSNSYSHEHCCVREPMENRCCLRARLCLLGLDLSRHRHCGGADSSGRHVCGALFDRGRGHARLLRADRTPHSFLGAPAQPSGGGRHSASNGRQSHAFLRGADRPHRPGRAADCGFATLVSGARQPLAGRPSHRAARKDRPRNRHRR